MGKAAVIFNDTELFEQIDNTSSTDGPCDLEKIGQAVSEKKTFKGYQILKSVYSPGARADNLGGGGGGGGQNFKPRVII